MEQAAEGWVMSVVEGRVVGRGLHQLTLDVEPGMSLTELAVEVADIGLDADTFLALVSDPGWAGLEGTTWETDSLERMLYPGRYPVLTANPQELIVEMMARLRADVTTEIGAAANARGLTMSELLDRASVVQANTLVPAEMPVVAEWALARPNLEPAPIAPTLDAMRAVLWPTNLGLTDLPAVGAMDDEGGGGVDPAGGGLLDPLLRPPLRVSGRVSNAVGHGGELEAGHGAEVFFETGGLEALAVALVVETMVAGGELALADPVVVTTEQLDRELPEERDRFRTLDVGHALDLVVDDGSETAVAALIGHVGVDDLEARLRALGVTSTSVRSRPMVTTAADTVRMAHLLHLTADRGPVDRDEGGDDDEGAGRGTLFDRFLARPSGSRMAGDYANRSGFFGFAVRRPGLHHDVGRLLSRDRERIVVHLSENGNGSVESARHTSHVAGLWARAYQEEVEGEGGGCRFGATGIGPLAGLVIGIDVAHGGKDRGATAEADTGRHLDEATVGLAMGLELQEQLAAEGAEVVMTRCEDVDLGVGERAFALNAGAVDLALSIHTDELGGSDINLPSVGFYREEAQALAEAVAGDAESGLERAVSRRNVVSRLTVNSDDDSLLVLVQAPAVRVETISLAVPVEAAAIGDALQGDGDRIDVLMAGIVEGVATFASRS